MAVKRVLLLEGTTRYCLTQAAVLISDTIYLLTKHHYGWACISETACPVVNYVYWYRKTPDHLLVWFLFFVADVDDLQDVVVSMNLQCPDVDLDVVLEEVLWQRANLLRPRCTPHQSLSVWLNASHSQWVSKKSKGSIILASGADPGPWQLTCGRLKP